MKNLLKEYFFSDDEINDYLSTYSFDRAKNSTLKNNFISCFNYLIKLKYTKLETFDIIKKCPKITSYSEVTLDKKINNIKKLGYSNSQVLLIIKSFPTILTYSEDTINKKIDDITFILSGRKKVLNTYLKKPNLFSHSIYTIETNILGV